MTSPVPLVLSLFPGIGLLDQAFEEAGFCVVRGPDLLWGGDVCSFHPPRGRFDGIVGGPPCQAFSRMRHIVAANGFETAPNLIPEFERVVAEAAPSWFLMENVEEAPVPSVEGFQVHDVVLCDHWVGGATSRRRRFSFGTAAGV
ncbi:DNA cytosine methyltransferase, partial [Methylobacterium hispanicum]